MKRIAILPALFVALAMAAPLSSQSPTPAPDQISEQPPTVTTADIVRDEAAKAKASAERLGKAADVLDDKPPVDESKDFVSPPTEIAVGKLAKFELIDKPPGVVWRAFARAAKQYDPEVHADTAGYIAHVETD